MGAFYKAFWDVIKDDLMDVVNAFTNLRSNSLQLLNSANVILIPKKEGAECVSDYSPISLIHGAVKLISKVLANRLQPFMNFIKKRSIHDNFMYVRNLARKFHQTRKHHKGFRYR